MAVNLSTCIYNGVAPVALSIADQRVSSAAPQAFSRGIAFDIAGQLFSASPALGDNNTWVTQSNFCRNATDYSCIAGYGGTYNPALSTSVYTTADATAWNGTQGADFLTNGQVNSVFYNDAVRIGAQTLYGLPFYTYTYNGSTNPAGLSLGQNSSFLKAALNARVIGSKMWSLWPGNMYNDVDGLLVLGGYDEARVNGSFQEFAVSKDTSDKLYVLITKMVWQNSTKTTDLLGTSGSQWAYIEPYWDEVTMGSTAFNNWISVTGGRYSLSSSWDYDWASIPSGNLVITFNNGHKTTIPAEDLFQRPARYNSQGALNVTNSTVWWPRVEKKSENSDMVLGTPFLTNKLLVTNWDKGTFSLADAIKTKMSTSDRNITSLCTPASSTNGTSTPVPTTEPKKSNVAAIAGGVGGGIGALLLIGLIAFFVIRRRRNQKKLQTATAVSEIPHYPHQPPPKYPSVGVYETNHAVADKPLAAPVYPVEQHIPELNSPPPTSPITGFSQTAWRESRTDGGYNDNSTVVNSTIGTSERDYHSRSPLGSEHLGATSGPLEMPSSHEMHYNTQRGG